MSNMRALLESMTQLSTEQTHRVVEQDLSEELMLEFRRFIRKENIVSTDSLQANTQPTGTTVGATPSPATGMNPAPKPAPGVNTSATPSPATGMNPAPKPGQTIKPVAAGQPNQPAMAAQQVNNLTLFVDYNKWQATGRSNEVLGLAPLAVKWQAFGWATAEINGHSFEEMHSALTTLQDDPRPKAIVCNTVKGKGIPFMEDDNNWHYRIPSAEEVVQSASILGISADKIQLEGRTPISHG
jgi:hypothetical protein